MTDYKSTTQEARQQLFRIGRRNCDTGVILPLPLEKLHFARGACSARVGRFEPTVTAEGILSFSSFPVPIPFSTPGGEAMLDRGWEHTFEEYRWLWLAA